MDITRGRTESQISHLKKALDHHIPLMACLRNWAWGRQHNNDEKEINKKTESTCTASLSLALHCPAALLEVVPALCGCTVVAVPPRLMTRLFWATLHLVLSITARSSVQGLCQRTAWNSVPPWGSFNVHAWACVVGFKKRGAGDSWCCPGCAGFIKQTGIPVCAFFPIHVGLHPQATTE